MSTNRAAAIAGGTFALFFLLGFFSVGPVIGAFADSERAFVEHFADDSQRAFDIVGGYLLVGSGIAFLVLSHFLALMVGGSGGSGPAVPGVIRALGLLVAGAIILASVALIAVPVSKWFGDFYGDPGVEEAQAALPHLGYLALSVGAMLPAAAMIFIVARSGVLAKWVTVTSYPIAGLLLLGVFFMPMLLLPVWASAASIALWRTIDPGSAPSARSA